MRSRLLAFFALALVSPFGTLAAQKSEGHHVGASIGLRFGTLGIGVEASKLLVPHVGVRASANFFKFHYSLNDTDLSFDANVKMKAITGLVDLYPSALGKFHFTGGVITNPVSVDGSGVPSGDNTFDINDKTYTAAQVGTVSAAIAWPSASPYVGIGFGNPAWSHGRVGFVADMGAAIGKGKVVLGATGAANNAALRADLTAQTAKIQKDLDKFVVYPIFTSGFIVRF